MTEAFQELSWLPSEQTVARCMPVIAAFVSYAYVKKEVCVNELKYEIFVSSSSNELRDIPPSLDALSPHVCLSAFQAGWIWGNSVSQAACPSAQWGWVVLQDELHIKWTTDVRALYLEELTKICKCDCEMRQLPLCQSKNSMSEFLWMQEKMCISAERSSNNIFIKSASCPIFQ